MDKVTAIIIHVLSSSVKLQLTAQLATVRTLEIKIRKRTADYAYLQNSAATNCATNQRLTQATQGQISDEHKTIISQHL